MPLPVREQENEGEKNRRNACRAVRGSLRSQAKIEGGLHRQPVKEEALRRDCSDLEYEGHGSARERPYNCGGD